MNKILKKLKEKISNIDLFNRIKYDQLLLLYKTETENFKKEIVKLKAKYNDMDVSIKTVKEFLTEPGMNASVRISKLKKFLNIPTQKRGNK